MRLKRPAVLPLWLAGLALCSGAAFAQDKPEPPAPEDPEIVIAPNPDGSGWRIDQLFDFINRFTGVSILYDSGNATFKQAKVEFTGKHTIKESELFDWLQAVLSYRKLVLVPVGPKSSADRVTGKRRQQWFVMDQADPNLKSRPVYIDESEIDRYADRDGLYIVTTLSLRYINDTTRVRNALSPLSTATAGIGRIQDIPGSRALIVGDFAPVVAAMKRLLTYIDIPNPQIEPTMKLVPLEHAVASELEPLLTELIQARDAGQPRPPRQPGSPDEEPEPKIIADNRLDALIIYATAAPMAKIEELIAKLDVPSRARGRLHFYALKHTDAADMAQLLDDLITSTSSQSSGTFAGTSRNRSTRTTNRPTTGTGPQPGGGALSGSAVEGSPVIIADPKSNSLIVQASPTQWEILEGLILKLDQSRPQVLIETSLIELSLSDQLNLGVEAFSTDDNVTVDTDGDGVADAITNERALFSNTNFGLTNIVTTDINGVLVPTNKTPLIGTGATVGIFKNGRLPFILSAFQSSGRARILTQPSLVTNDNEKASITLERKTSFRETVRDSTNTTQDSFKEVTANTELSISPHISSDDYLRLEITQSVSNFGNRPSPDAPPDTITRKLDTNVTLPDTYTVVLGGLIQEEERTSVSKVPVLGDIPILGFFFRQTEDQSNPSHLFLFVTPRILRDSKFASYHKLTWEKKLQQDDLFQREVDFPSRNFMGPHPPETSEDKLRALEESGELDAGRLKAPLTNEERIRQAEEFMKSQERKPAEPPAETPPPAPPTPAEPEKK